MSARFPVDVITGNGTFSGHVGIAGVPVTSDVMLSVAAGTVNAAPIRLDRGSLTTIPVCGNIMYDGHMVADVCGGLRTHLDATIFIQYNPTTITDSAPNVETSLLGVLGTGIGTRVLPGYLLRLGKTIRLKHRTTLSTRNGKDATMSIYIGSNVLASTITYTNNTTDVYAEIDLDILCASMAGTVATVVVSGRTLYGTGPSGSTVSMRYIHGIIAGIQTTLPNTIDVTFKWSDVDIDVRNTLTTDITTLQLID